MYDCRFILLTCIMFGLIASLSSTVRAPVIPRSSGVIGTPVLLLATTIRPVNIIMK